MERLSVLPVSFFPALSDGSMTIVEWAKMAKSLGLYHIDVPNWAFRSHLPVYLNRLRQELDQLGVHLAMLGTYSDFTHPDALQRKRELNYLKRDTALASQMGAKILRVTDGQAHPGTSRQCGVEWAVEGLCQAAETAKEYGVRLAFENHGQPSAWIYDDFSHPVDIFLEIAAKLKGSGVGINFDNGNATGCGVDAVELLEQVYDQVISLHLSDTSSRETTVHTALGAGISPVAPVLEYLKKRDYQGWFSIEEDSGRGLDGIYQAICHVRGIWDELDK